MVDNTEQKLELAIENMKESLDFWITELFNNKNNIDSVLALSHNISRGADLYTNLIELRDTPLASIDDFSNMKK